MNKIEILTVAVELDNHQMAKKTIKEFIESFDADLSGENGLDYVSDEAKQNGYESNVDWWIDNYELLSTYEMLESIMDNVCDTYDVANYQIDLDIEGKYYNLVFCYGSN